MEGIVSSKDSTEKNAVFLNTNPLQHKSQWNAVKLSASFCGQVTKTECMKSVQLVGSKKERVGD